MQSHVFAIKIKTVWELADKFYVFDCNEQNGQGNIADLKFEVSDCCPLIANT